MLANMPHLYSDRSGIPFMARGAFGWLGRLRRALKAFAAPTGNEPVCVLETSHPLEAEVLKGVLETHGFPVMIQRDSVRDAYPVTVGDMATCRILVPASLADQALAVLSETPQDAGGPESVPDDQAQSSS